MKLHRSSLFGGILLVSGALLLLHRFDIIHVRWSLVLWGTVSFVGLRWLVNGVRLHRGGPVFWGSQSLLFGIYQIIGFMGVISNHWYYLAPSWLVFIGMSFVLMSAAQPVRLHLLVPALAFPVVGVTLFLAEFGVLSRWDVTDAIERYWPVGLILFGCLMLVSHIRLARRLKGADDVPERVV